MNRRQVLSVLPGLLTASASRLAAQQASAGWRIGLAKAKITPTKPMRMAGYAARTRPFEGVTSDLYAKAMALEDGDGGLALVITADTLGFPGELSERICARIKAADGLERKSILLNASHTHAGPLVVPRLGYPMEDGERALVVDYGKTLEDKVAAMAHEALANRRPARLSWSAGVVDFVMNRREFTEKGVILGVNPRGPADRSVPVLRVEGEDGTLRAVLFGAACHCTTLGGDNLNIDAEYAGYAQTWVESRHPGALAMFMTGCAGDANPYPRGTLELAKRHGESLGAEATRVVGGKMKPVRGPLRTELRRVNLPLQKFTRAEVDSLIQGAPSYRRFFTDGAKEILDRGEELPRHYNAPFALWQFGQDLTLVGFSGETLVDYAAFAEKALGPLNLWVAGYCNDLFGYLPSARVLAEGGYETRGMYMGVGIFSPDTQDVIIEALKDMARAVGRR